MNLSGCFLNLSVWVAALVIMGAGSELKANDYALQILHPFLSPGPLTPASGVVRLADGSLYGVTPQGDGLTGGNGYGTIYRIGPDGQISVLYVFDGTYGYYPTSGLVEGNDGNFYGAPETAPGGAFLNFFKITPSGVFTNICSLVDGTNGYDVASGMILACDGNFYGTTRYGGAGYTNPYGNGGTVFELTTNGVHTVLNSFVGTNGFQPVGRLMQASNGNIYGTTADGGQFDSGTVFSITPAGDFNTLYSFAGADGVVPQAGLVEGKDGWLYGVGVTGVYSSQGVIYKISTNGDFAVVATMNNAEGSYPQGSLILDDDGRMYGVAQLGGDDNGGTVFRLTTNSTIEVIASFNDGTGLWPTELSKGQDGNIYGTTSVQGGSYCDGTVFRLVQVPVFNLSTRSNGAVQLNWTAFAGGAYEVQYEDSLLCTNWSLLAARVTATTNSACFFDPVAARNSRFYRLNVLPW